MNEPQQPGDEVAPPVTDTLSVPPDVVRHSVWQMRGGLEYKTVVEPAVWVRYGDITAMLADLLKEPDYPGKAGDVERLRQFVLGPTGGPGARRRCSWNGRTCGPRRSGCWRRRCGHR